MRHSDPRTLGQLDQQLKWARQLRSETVAGVVARAMKQLSIVLRRMAGAIRGAHHPSVPNWRG
jgi:hypothetical protein